MMKPLLLAAAAAAGALALAAATPLAGQPSLASPQGSLAPKPKAKAWQATITRTPRGHLIGNPEADGRLIEFISYTCPHCAQFAIEGEPAIELALLGPGKLALEVRPVIRNAIDLTVSLLAQCGDPAGFKTRHQVLMLSQSDWLARAENAPQSQQQIWARGDKAARMKMASALGLSAMLAKRGQSQAEIDACLMDDAAAKALIRNARDDYDEFAVPGTPSFALDGKLLADVHSWKALYPVLSARFAPQAPG